MKRLLAAPALFLGVFCGSANARIDDTEGMANERYGLPTQKTANSAIYEKDGYQFELQFDEGFCWEIKISIVGQVMPMEEALVFLGKNRGRMIEGQYAFHPFDFKAKQSGMALWTAHGSKVRPNESLDAVYWTESGILEITNVFVQEKIQQRLSEKRQAEAKEKLKDKF